ncbi:MAG: hypothetical protein AAFU71_18950 [Cyanobacteria bacterium J06632_22]
MVQTSRKIQQSIEQLERQTIQLGDELQTLYKVYFDVLSMACQRQLVLAAYHVCTQVYPEAFLRLSYSKREKLQKTLQQLGAQVQEQLQERWQQAQKASQKSFQEDGLALIKQLFSQAEAARSDSDASSSQPLSSTAAPSKPLSPADQPDEAATAADTSNDDSRQQSLFEDELGDWLAEPQQDQTQQDQAQQDKSNDSDQPRYRLLKVEETATGTNIAFVDGENPERASLRDRLIARLSAHQGKAATAESNTASSQDGDEPPVNNTAADSSSDSDHDTTSEANEPAAVLSEPTQLLRLQLFTEKAIRDVLKTISETANYLLQQDGIIPEMPKALLAAAAESDGLSQTPMKTPNLLKISVRVLHDSDDDELDDDEPDDASDDDDQSDAEEAADLDDDLSHRLEQILKARALRERETETDDNDGTDQEMEGLSSRLKERLPRIVQIESLPEFIVIHLRLSEVEFADPHTAAQRRLIRGKMNELKKLGRVYKKAQRQLAIAQAEDAWRASWIE